MSSKISLPTMKAPKKGKVLFLVAFVIGLCFVVNDPLGSAAVVRGLFGGLGEFGANLSGGAR